MTIEHGAREQLVANLLESIADRAAREAELVAHRDRARGALESAHRQDVSRRRAEAEEQLATLREEYAAARKSADAQYQEISAQTRSEYDRLRARVQREYDEGVSAARTQFDESRWMVDSVFDEHGDDTPAQQFDAYSQQYNKTKAFLDSEWSELHALHEDVQSLLTERHQRLEGEFPPPRERDLPPQELVEHISKVVATVRERAAQLRRHGLSRLFAGANGYWLGLLLFAALTPIALATRMDLPDLWQRPDRVDWAWCLIACGIGAAGSLLVVITLLGLARRQTDALQHALRQALSDARWLIMSWKRATQRELQQKERRRDAWLAEVGKSRSASLEKAEEILHARLEQLKNARDTRLQDAQRTYPELLAAQQADRDARLAELELTYPVRINACEAELQELAQHSDADYHQQIEAITRTFEEEWHALQKRWQRAVDDFAGTVREWNRALAEQFPDWQALAVGPWDAPRESPDDIPFGHLLVDLEQIPRGQSEAESLRCPESQYHVPATLPFSGNPSLLIETDATGRRQAIALLQVAMLRMLTAIPAGKLRFTLIDPIGLGESFAAFMHLADYDELMIGSRIWTEAAQIEKRLSLLTEHMENVFQTYLRNEFATIQEYNHYAGEVAEPYHVLVIADFPQNFSELAARRLLSIASSGARCGVYLLFSARTDLPLPPNFRLDDLKEEIARLTCRGDTCTWNSPHLARLPLHITPTPDGETFGRIVRHVGEGSRDARRVEVPFERIAPGPNELWSLDSRTGLDVPLGRAGATKLQYMRLGRGTAQHVLVAGKTGSGKSTFLHILITNLALHYSPQQVEFYLVDFKKGVEFKAYADGRLPHARVVAIESDREFGLSVLERLDAVLKERGDLFRNSGVPDLPGYREAHPGTVMPRQLLVIDEFQEFFVEDDAIAQRAALLLDRLVRQGRAFGIHVLLGSQTLSGAYTLARSTLGQVAVRVALQCSETDAHLILSEENTAARLLTRPGEAIYNDANGLVDGNHPFQIAWIADEQRNRYLSHIQTLTQEQGLKLPAPVVFEGNQPARPEHNAQLSRLLSGPAPTSVPASFPAWLGEAIAIKPPTSLELRPQAGMNVLVCGQDELAAQGLLSMILLSLAAQLPHELDSELATFQLLDGRLPRAAAGTSEPAPGTGPETGSVSSRVPDGCADWPDLVVSLPQSVALVSPGQAAGPIAQLAEEVRRRQESDGRNVAPIFVVVNNLAGFRDLRKSEDDFGFGSLDSSEPPSTSQQFTGILKDGPSVGIHVIVWCDTFANANRWFSTQTLREFETRIAFQMNATDSSNFLETPAASRLGPHRAIVSFLDRGQQERFRPYGPPTLEWLDQIGAPAQDDSDSEFCEDIDMWTVT